MILVIISLLIIIIIILCYRKESYRRQKRQGIRMPWRRAGGAGRTLALRGTRHPKLPNPLTFYDDIHNYMTP